MTEWISVTDRPPSHGQKVKIKTFDLEDNPIEIACVFRLMDVDEHFEAWIWSVGQEKTIASPTHWMPCKEADLEDI